MKKIIITAAILLGVIGAGAQDITGVSNGKKLAIVRPGENVVIDIEGEYMATFTGKTIFMINDGDITSYVRVSEIEYGTRSGRDVEIATYKNNDTGEEYDIEKEDIVLEDGPRVIFLYVWHGEEAFELYTYIIN